MLAGLRAEPGRSRCVVGGSRTGAYRACGAEQKAGWTLRQPRSDVGVLHHGRTKCPRCAQAHCAALRQTSRLNTLSRSENAGDLPLAFLQSPIGRGRVGIISLCGGFFTRRNAISAGNARPRRFAAQPDSAAPLRSASKLTRCGTLLEWRIATRPPSGWMENGAACPLFLRPFHCPACLPILGVEAVA